MIKLRFKFLFVLSVLVFMFAGSASFSGSASFAGSVSAYDVQSLLDYYVQEFKPEKALLVIQDKPDETGMFTDIYMSLEGVMIETLRLNRLDFRYIPPACFGERAFTGGRPISKGGASLKGRILTRL